MVLICMDYKSQQFLSMSIHFPQRRGQIHKNQYKKVYWYIENLNIIE